MNKKVVIGIISVVIILIITILVLYFLKKNNNSESGPPSSNGENPPTYEVGNLNETCSVITQEECQKWAVENFEGEFGEANTGPSCHIYCKTENQAQCRQDVINGDYESAKINGGKVYYVAGKNDPSTSKFPICKTMNTPPDDNNPGDDDPEDDPYPTFTNSQLSEMLTFPYSTGIKDGDLETGSDGYPELKGLVSCSSSRSSYDAKASPPGRRFFNPDFEGNCKYNTGLNKTGFLNFSTKTPDQIADASKDYAGYGGNIPAKTSRQRILQRAVGYLALGVKYVVYDKHKGPETEFQPAWEVPEPPKDSDGNYVYPIVKPQPWYLSFHDLTWHPVEVCSEFEDNPEFRNPAFPCPRMESNGQCCGLPVMAWMDANGATGGYCGIASEKYCYPIDPIDLLPGDVIIYGGNGKCPVWYNMGDSVQDVKGGPLDNSKRHVTIFRRFIGTPQVNQPIQCEIWQLGGGNGQMNQSTFTINQTATTPDTTRMCMRRRNIVNDDGTWEIDGYLENKNDPGGTKVALTQTLFCVNGNDVYSLEECRTNNFYGNKKAQECKDDPPYCTDSDCK